MPRLDDWKKDLRRWGFRRCVYKRLMVGLGRWITLCGVYVRPLDADYRVPASADGLEVRVATKPELERHVADPDLDLRQEFLTAAFERGDMCVAVFDGQRIVAFIWRSFTTAPHRDGLWVQFRKPYRYGYKAYTRPEFRGRHLPNILAPYLDRFCIDHGFTHSIGFIETHNYPSIASDLRRGSRLVGWAGYVKVFGRVVPFRSPGARRHGFAFVSQPGASASAAEAYK